MRRSELALVRVPDLEPGQRVRMPRQRPLQTVVDVHSEETDAGRVFILNTDVGAYVCEPTDLIDTEVNGEVWL